MTKKWSDVRNQAVREGRLDEKTINEHKRRMLRALASLRSRPDSEMSA